MIKKANRLVFLLLIGALCGGLLTGYAFGLTPILSLSPEEVDDFVNDRYEEVDDFVDDRYESPEVLPDEPSNLFMNYWWAFATGGGILVLGCVLLVVYKKKKTSSLTVAPASIQCPVLIGNTHHIGARESQQDSFVISDLSNAALCASKGILGVVADGMGGMADGAEVSSIVTRTMLQYFNEVAPSGHPELDLLNMLNAANDNVNRFMSGRDKGGSTAVAVIVHDGKLYWAAVGDSRICLIRNGAIMQVNREHVYSVDLDEKAATGEISWESAAGNPKRNALTSYLGMKTLEKVDRSLRAMQLIEGDRILLMSDGVFNDLTEAEILEAMSFSPQESAIQLQEMTLAKQNPNQDNLTAVIFEYRGVPK